MSVLKFKKISENAVIPDQKTSGSCGFDLTCIAEHKVISPITKMYKTGLIVVPLDGFHTEIVPRSSIIKTGYVLANSVGIIDNDYRGELLIVLTKIDESKPDLVVPFCVTQLLLRKDYEFTVSIVDEISETVRGNGGFGSTN